MPVFAYRAFTSSGKSTSGVIDADTGASAREKLREMGLVPTALNETQATAVRSGQSVRSWWPRGNAPESVAFFTREVSILLEAGMPLVDALNAVLEQMAGDPLESTVLRVKEDVSQGESYSEALGHHPRYFSSMYTSMVRAGEASGALEVVLARLADYLERRGQVRRRIQSAMVYPAVMSVFGLGVVAFLLAYIVPKVTQILFQLGSELPLPTRILLALSGFVQSWWWLLLIGVVVVVVVTQRYLQTEAGRAQWDAVRLRMPFLKGITQAMVVSRFARTLGTLLRSGVPLLDALGIVVKVVNHAQFERAIDDVHVSVRKGDHLAGAMRRTGIFPPIVLHMVALGERSGQLEGMLIKTADRAEEDLERGLTTFVSLLEPAMIIFMGVVVGFVVLAILLPILGINTQLG